MSFAVSAEYYGTTVHACYCSWGSELHGGWYGVLGGGGGGGGGGVSCMVGGMVSLGGGEVHGGWYGVLGGRGVAWWVV